MTRRFSTGTPFREGGTASLYTARDLALGRTVVLKVPHGAGAGQLERTFREARALAAIRHPGVCQVYDVGFDEGRPFIALEWVEGPTLTETSAELTGPQRLELVARVAEAIEAVHRAGVIHRDLKPDNVMVRRADDGTLQPVVVDFGLVRFEDEEGIRTLAGLPLGTPGYMAPEQVRGEAAGIDARTDVFGLGAILYFVLTGHAAFEGGDDGEGAAQVMFSTLHSEPRPPRAWNPEISADLEAVVLQCLAHQPARRYARAQDVADELRRILSGQSVRARRAGPLARLGRRLRRHPTRVALAAGLALLAATGAFVARSEIERHGDRSAYFQRWADDLEWRLRAEAMAPRHDISKSEEIVRGSVLAVTEGLARLDPAARANGLFALGRVWAALHDDAQAERHLRAAWTLGRNGPEVAYTLGLVLGRRYEAAMARAARISNPTLRAERAQKLDLELRAPARSFLARAGGARLPVPEEYPQILIATHDGRFDEALASLAALRRRVPWFYEAWTTEGAVLEARSTTAYASGKTEEALRLLQRAHEAYRQARGAGQSDPVVHEGLCSTAADIAGTRQELAMPADPAGVDAALAACSDALAVSPRHASTLSVASRIYELAARFAQFDDGDAERAGALLARADDLATRAAALAPADPDIQSNLLAVLVTQNTFGEIPDGAWFTKLAHTSKVLEANLSQEHGSLDFIQLVQAHSARQQWTTRQLRPAPPDLERLVSGFTKVHERAPRCSSVPAALVYALRTLTQARDLYGEPTEDLDRQMLRYAEEALAGNPRFVDTQTSLAVALTYNGTRRCSRSETWRDLFERADRTLATTRALGQARLLVSARTAWVRVSAAQCALALGEEAGALATRAGRSAERAVAVANHDKMTIDLERAARLTEWRALLANPRATPAELRRAANLPPIPAPEPTPLAALNANEWLLTQADLALELGEDPTAFLEGVEERLARVERELRQGRGEARRPLALERQRALLAFFRARTLEDPPGRAEQAEAGARVLELPLAGTRADLAWLYWRRRVATLLHGQAPPRPGAPIAG